MDKFKYIIKVPYNPYIIYERIPLVIITRTSNSVSISSKVNLGDKCLCGLDKSECIKLGMQQEQIKKLFDNNNSL